MSSEMFPILIAQRMIQAGCHISVAQRVRLALEDRTDAENMIFWLRMQGRSYGDIGELMEMNKGLVWRIVHGSLKRCVYSVLESATALVS
jgi:hypothetical protein